MNITDFSDYCFPFCESTHENQRSNIFTEFVPSPQNCRRNSETRSRHALQSSKDMRISDFDKHSQHSVVISLQYQQYLVNETLVILVLTPNPMPIQQSTMTSPAKVPPLPGNTSPQKRPIFSAYMLLPTYCLNITLYTFYVVVACSWM